MATRLALRAVTIPVVTARRSSFVRAVLSGVVVLLALWPIADCGGSPEPEGPVPTPTPAGWTLVWSDEFDGPAGASVDRSRWTFDIGGDGWGNEELETYTDRTANASLDGSGNLVIVAAREAFRGPDGIPRAYTSARLKTQGLFAQAYGRFEGRMQVPYGQGLWPAFWLLGADIPTVGWPACGEIDVMENIGVEPGTVHGSLHSPRGSDVGSVTASFALPAGQRFADDFHVFAVEWEPSQVRFSVDGTLYQTRTPADLPPGSRWVFDHPFFVILNVAVGGKWPGSPDATTTFPQRMRVDYVRVYSRPSR
jgi:beta-glucanase (GH16 family)